MGAADVLVQGPAHENIDCLHAPADAEEGKLFLERVADDGFIELVVFRFDVFRTLVFLVEMNGVNVPPPGRRTPAHMSRRCSQPKARGRGLRLWSFKIFK